MNCPLSLFKVKENPSVMSAFKSANSVFRELIEVILFRRYWGSFYPVYNYMYVDFTQDETFKAEIYE